MGKYKEFTQPLKPKGQLPKMLGSYGCQSCSIEVDHAWFDEFKDRMFWFCPEGHESEIKLNV
jgi:hypothetical protein